MYVQRSLLFEYSLLAKLLKLCRLGFLRSRVWSRAVGAVMGGGGSSAPAEQAEQPAVRDFGCVLFPRVFYSCGCILGVRLCFCVPCACISIPRPIVEHGVYWGVWLCLYVYVYGV